MLAVRVRSAPVFGAVSALAAACLLGLVYSASAENASNTRSPTTSVVDSGEEMTVGAAEKERHRRTSSAGTTAERWLKIISESAPEVLDAVREGRSDWTPRIITLPLGEGKESVPLPLLVLPVRVRGRSEPRAECDNRRVETNRGTLLERYDENFKPSQSREGSGAKRPHSTPPADRSAVRPRPVTDRTPLLHRSKRPLSTPQPHRDYAFDDDDYLEEYGSRVQPTTPPVLPTIESKFHRTTIKTTTKLSRIQNSEISRQLLQLFRAQSPKAPELPPAVIPVYTSQTQTRPRPRPNYANEDTIDIDREYQLDDDKPPPSESHKKYNDEDPPHPLFDRSVWLKAELTVHRADYTEPYDVRWDASSGAARVDFHGPNATSTYRQILSDGRMQLFEKRIDRTGLSDVVRCARSSPRPPSPTDTSHPALPPVELFSFNGYAEVEGERAERWRRVERGGSGELGAARGEALTVHHELLLRRTSHRYATPIKYTVSVDSSVLGSGCDGYEHRYVAVSEQQHEATALEFDNTACDHMETLDVADLDHLARLDPLREFTLLHRDSRYDAVLESYKVEFSRHYVDNMEEAVRKNQLIQNSRFVNSGNRQGSTFEMALNFLADRLDAEVRQLLGVVLAEERIPAEKFPHSHDEIYSLADSLPREFDWRQHGAVTPVRYQGGCRSCWAFAVTGAVEGALFRRTRRLVPLSEKTLVDCGHESGAHGCGGTWPSFAYDYVQEFGLPARSQYPDYNEKLDQCSSSRTPPATYISAHVNVTHRDIVALKVAIKHHAPTVVIIDAETKSFQLYKKGVLIDKRCGRMSPRLNHAVLAVGWGAGRSGKTHFILKNSWSAGWGEGGYIRVFAPGNTCGVLSLPSYPRLAPDDVQQPALDHSTVAPDRGLSPPYDQLDYD